jgi:hypothetical protein
MIGTMAQKLLLLAVLSIMVHGSWQQGEPNFRTFFGVQGSILLICFGRNLRAKLTWGQDICKCFFELSDPSSPYKIKATFGCHRFPDHFL